MKNTNTNTKEIKTIYIYDNIENCYDEHIKLNGPQYKSLIKKLIENNIGTLNYNKDILFIKNKNISFV